MTTLIVGLGNPGPEYALTRHNIGFLALDRLREEFGAPEFRPEAKFFADLSSTIVNGNKVILAKPTTYMNESGRAVRAILDYYKLDPKSLAVIHDDLDIAPGTLRATDSSRAAGHNGVQDIIDVLGTQDFFRLRLGIGRPVDVEGACMSSHDYVLGRFSEAESNGQAALFDALVAAVRARLSS
ncbi:MAG: aminoacyl-tRNA hydrolase [Candidatus Moraniibacteriota bacterium]|nr:MAG: aminoacyl-tRNA hydrolase [Candidatus Moranbacteria bacterium]